MIQVKSGSGHLAAATLASFALMALGAASARAGSSPNLLTNGSFEDIGTGTVVSGQSGAAGVGVLPGWTISANTTGYSYGSGPGDGPQLIVTNGTTPAPYGDRIAADPFTYGPDGAGGYALYFVDDDAHETVSQTISMVAGTTYEVGFDMYLTPSGAGNPGGFTLTASIGSSILDTATPQTLTAGEWYHFAATYTPTTTGLETFVFSYTSADEISKDVVVDQVYVEDPPTTPGVGANTGDSPIGTPEPPGITALLAGIVALGCVRFTRRSRPA